MVVAHLIVDVPDTVGSNAVNTMEEPVAGWIDEVTGGKVRLRILSNLADLRFARAQVRYSADTLKTKKYSGKATIDGVLDAHIFAAADPYRAPSVRVTIVLD